MSGAAAEVTPARAAELLEAGEAELVDVREADELAESSIDGARHIELGRLTAEADSIDRSRPVVFVCRTGARSAMATEAFRASGWDAYNLAGGIVAWSRDGLPVTGSPPS